MVTNDSIRKTRQRESMWCPQKNQEEEAKPPGINPGSEVMGLWIPYLMPQNVRFLICKTRAKKSTSRIGYKAYVEDQ